ncbi:MAG: SSS family solute:Na+ symporter, partial [Limisphaerales bacterium]
MHSIDWIVLCSTLLAIVFYGVWKTRKVSNTESYLLGDRELKWYTIGLSIMATQASAITFLSTPGKAFQDGMGFAQFYFGLPIAMVLLAAFVLPYFYRLKVYTAYEFLEGRFGLPTRTLAAIFFLFQRGLSAGLTIFAPAIILSSILGWPLWTTNITIGFLVIIYTVAGGTNAVSQTQRQQMILILGGMVIAAGIAISHFPSGVSIGDAMSIAGKMGKLDIIDTKFSFENKYNIWSGLLASTFLFLSYFGADQSQVQRYLSGKSLSESRMGLLFNGIVKVPMQMLVLFTGILVFLLFQFEKPPVHFIENNLEVVELSENKEQLSELQQEYDQNFADKTIAVLDFVEAKKIDNEAGIEEAIAQISTYDARDKEIRVEVNELIKASDPSLNTRDGDYVFITFVIQYLPIGLIGLLLAVIFSAAMSSTASEINALATTTVVDLYRRSIFTKGSDQHYLKASKYFT